MHKTAYMPLGYVVFFNGVTINLIKCSSDLNTIEMNHVVQNIHQES